MPLDKITPVVQTLIVSTEFMACALQYQILNHNIPLVFALDVAIIIVFPTKSFIYYYNFFAETLLNLYCQ